MDTYLLALKVLSESKLAIAQTWPEMERLFKRAADSQPRDWRLPVLACEAVGGKPEHAAPAVAAIACAQISIILIDDLLDADPHGEHQTLGAPAAANLAAAFQAAALEVLGEGDNHCHPVVKLAAWRSLNQMILTTAFGQYLDIQNPADEAAYWKVVETKSAPFYGAALQLGALVGGASIEIAEQLQHFGHLYGAIIQIHDDLNDAMAAPANPDWTLGRTPLPILFAQLVDHSEQTLFLELRRRLQAAPDPEALAEAQRILIRCGAVSYGVQALMSRHQTAQAFLDTLPVSHPAGLDLLLEKSIEPVNKLFAALETS